MGRHNKGGLPDWSKSRRAEVERFSTMDDSQLLNLSYQFAKQVKNARPGSLSDGSFQLNAAVNIIKDRIDRDGLQGHQQFTSLVHAFSHLNQTELRNAHNVADAVLRSEPPDGIADTNPWKKYLPGQNQS